MTILHQEDILEPATWIISIVVVLFVIVEFAVILNCIRKKLSEKSTNVLRCMLYFVLPCVVLFVVLVTTFVKVDSGKDRYTAILSEDVSANYLYENYTNINYDDGVFTFEDR